MILTIRVARHDDGTISVIDNLSGARCQGPALAGTMAMLAAVIQARYEFLAALSEPWPHQQRARDQLARFFEETP